MGYSDKCFRIGLVHVVFRKSKFVETVVVIAELTQYHSFGLSGHKLHPLHRRASIGHRSYLVW